MMDLKFKMMYITEIPTRALLGIPDDNYCWDHERKTYQNSSASLPPQRKSLYAYSQIVHNESSRVVHKESSQPVDNRSSQALLHGSSQVVHIESSQAVNIGSSQAVHNGSCPSLSTDHGSEVTSNNFTEDENSKGTTKEGILTVDGYAGVSILSKVRTCQLLFRNTASQTPPLHHTEKSEDNREAPTLETEALGLTPTPTSLGSDDRACPDSGDQTDDEPKEIDSVYEIVLAAFRGEPELLPDVHDILQRELEAYRTLTAGKGGKPASTANSGSTTYNDLQQPRKPSKRRRVLDGDEEAPHDEGEPKPRRRPGCNVKKATVKKLKYGCMFHKMFPGKYCVHTHVSSTGTFYRPCAETGWAEIRHLIDHLKDKHCPHQCLRCLEVFASRQEMTTHQGGDCARNPDRLLKEGIDPAMLERILAAYKDARSLPPWTKEDIRWYKICFVLFPLSVPPKSPYVGEVPEVRLLRYVRDSLQNRLHNGLSGEAASFVRAIIDNITEMEPSLENFLEHAENSQAPASVEEHQGEVAASDSGVGNLDTLPGQDDPNAPNVSHVFDEHQDSNIDPALWLLQAAPQIQNMPYVQVLEQAQTQPKADGLVETQNETHLEADMGREANFSQEEGEYDPYFMDQMFY